MRKGRLLRLHRLFLQRRCRLERTSSKPKRPKRPHFAKVTQGQGEILQTDGDTHHPQPTPDSWELRTGMCACICDQLQSSSWKLCTACVRITSMQCKLFFTRARFFIMFAQTLQTCPNVPACVIIITRL